MDKIVGNQAKRFLFLNHLYKKVEGVTGAVIDLFSFGEEIGMGSQESLDVVSFLEEEGHIESLGMGGEIGITHKGIKYVENRLSQPSQSYSATMPQNIINIGTMINSNIQQASHHSRQTVSNNQDEMKDIVGFLKELQEKLALIDLSKEDRDVVESDMRTLESQIESPRPKNAVLRECLHSIRNILEGVQGSLIATMLIANFPQIPH